MKRKKIAFQILLYQNNLKKKILFNNECRIITIHASERPDFCLEIDPTEIFISNIYDILFNTKLLDDLSIKSFRVCLRPVGYIGKSSQNLEIFSNKNLNYLTENMEERNIEPIKENNDEENDKDKIQNVLKVF